jgi:hypothetical protein
MRDHLFLVFGSSQDSHRNKQTVVETIDCLTLLPGSGNDDSNSFFTIPLICAEDSQFIFDPNNCLMGSMFFEDLRNKSGRIYFFGGNSSGKPNKSNAKKS